LKALNLSGRLTGEPSPVVDLFPALKLNSDTNYNLLGVNNQVMDEFTERDY
jgi:hypothetical protein